MLLAVEGVLSIGRMLEDEEDCDETEGERRRGVPLAEEEVDSGISRLLFSFLKCSSRHCISFSSVISDGGGGSWPGRISSCSFGRAANPVTKLNHTKRRVVGGGRTFCQPQECSL